MKNKKALKLVASLALVATIGVGATLAYLTDQSNQLTNTFTVGEGYVPGGPDDLAVWIDETAIGDHAGETLYNENRTLKGNDYDKVLAGDILTKDPILRINKGSVKSYAFIQVEGLDALAQKGVTVNLNTDDWKKVSTTTGTVVDDDTSGLDGIYMFKKVINDDDGEGVLDPTNTVASTSALFNKVFVSGTFNATTLEDNDIVLKGCAVQAVVTNEGTEEILEQNEIAVPTFE